MNPNEPNTWNVEVDLNQKRANIPEVFVKILWTEAMDALMRLNIDMPHYHRTATNIIDIATFYERADFDDATGELIKSPWGTFHFNHDINELEKQIDSWEDVRQLWKIWFMKSPFIPELYAIMCENEKVAHTDLAMSDRDMFWYIEEQMESFIKIWIPIFSPTPGLVDSIIEQNK